MIPWSFDQYLWSPISGIKNLKSTENKVLLIVNASSLNKDIWSLDQHYIVVNIVVTTGKMTTIHYFDPNGYFDNRTFSTEYWNDIINWYGGFK